MFVELDKMGCEVVDKMTGFKGVITEGRVDWTGKKIYGVEKLDLEGKLVKGWFDTDRLDVIKEEDGEWKPKPVICQRYS